MKFNEPMPGPPHRNWKVQGIALLVFLLIMSVACVLGEMGVFRK